MTSIRFNGSITPSTGEFSLSTPSNTFGACPDDTRAGTVANELQKLKAKTTSP